MKKWILQKLNPIAHLESTNEGLLNETNPSSVAQFVLEILAEEANFRPKKTNMLQKSTCN